MKADNGLADWLRTATRGLPEDVAFSLREELQSHYEDAVREHLAQGKDSADAHHAALADLGDARQVGRALRRVHLNPVRRWWLALLRMRALFQRMVAAQRTPGTFPTFDFVGTLLFGLWVLGSTIMEQPKLGETGLDLVTPVALGFVLLGLFLEKDLAPWNYAAFGYLLLSGWNWVLFPLTVLRGAPGPESGNSTLWNLIVPWAPILLLLLLGVQILWRVFREKDVQIPRRAWYSVALLFIVYLAQWGLEIGISEPLSFWGFIRWLTVSVIYSVIYFIPVFVGLLGARRWGLVGLLIPLSFYYVWVIEGLDLSYHIDFYTYWSPTLLLRITRLVMRYLSVIGTFIITPGWLLAARSERGKALAAGVPWATMLMISFVLTGIGLQATPRAYALADWLRAGLQMLEYTLPLVFAAFLYRQFEGRTTEQDVEKISPAEPLVTT
jgi:hypothetical protein